MRLPRLHVITDDAVLARPDFVHWGCELLRLPVALHLRGPHTSARRLLELGRELGREVERSRAPESGILLVNDRVDVAMMLDAGVHLAARSLPATEVRRLRGDAALVGRSVRILLPEASSEEGLDYLLVGTIFASASHPGRPGDGLSDLAAGLPVIAIGGITPDRVGPVIRAGAHGVAALGGIWSGVPDGPSPARAAETYLEALETMGDDR